MRPTPWAFRGPIPGVVVAGDSTAESIMVGGAGAGMTGVVYTPNAPLQFSGKAQAGSTGCLQPIASSVALTGNSSLAVKCSAYGTSVFDSEGAGMALVQ